MARGDLDVSRWNLATASCAVSVALLAGCGPVIGGNADAADGSDTGPDDASSPSDPSDPTEPTATESSATVNPSGDVECFDDDDCGVSWDCVDGRCEYDPDCYCGYCYYDAVPPGVDLRCQPPIDCYSDAECSFGEECIYAGCLPLPECARELPVTLSDTQVFFAGAGAAVGPIGSGDVSPAPGVELLVARDDEVEVVSGIDGVVAIVANGTIVAMDVGDVDGDADADVVTATAGELQVWLATDGIFAPGPSLPVLGATALAIGDYAGDGSPDLFALSGGQVFWIAGEGDGSFATPQVLASGDIWSMSVADIDANGTTDVLWTSGVSLWAITSDAPPSSVVTAGASSVAGFVIADFDGDTWPDASLIGRSPDSLSTARGPLAGESTVHVMSFDTLVQDAGAGDLDGDGFADVAIARQDEPRIRVRFGGEVSPDGASDPLGCVADYDSPQAAVFVHIADLDGDGVGELVATDGVSVRLMRFGV